MFLHVLEVHDMSFAAHRSVYGSIVLPQGITVVVFLYSKLQT